MFEEEFKNRLSTLRINKGVSARDMSLSLGQNPGYINNIETGKALPSMSMFFYICEYLEISPKDFFETDLPRPNETIELFQDLSKLSDTQFECIRTLINELLHS